MSTELEEGAPKPGYLWSLFNLKCPRCRRGDLFTNNNAYGKPSLKYAMDMPDACPVCGQKFDLEPGFWFGTGYVSYALSVAFAGFTFVPWWLFIGINGNKIFYWLITVVVLLILLQPYLMRLSRALYISFFVNYDPYFATRPPSRK